MRCNLLHKEVRAPSVEIHRRIVVRFADRGKTRDPDDPCIVDQYIDPTVDANRCIYRFFNLVDPTAVGSERQCRGTLLPQRFSTLLHAIGIDVDQHQIGTATR